MNRRGAATGLCLLALLQLSMAGAQQAATAPPAALPEPLTLEYALSLADEPHPELQRRKAELDADRANEEAVDAASGWNTYLEGRLRYIQPPSLASDQSRDDHRFGLFVDKTLYDFGRSAAELEAARNTVRGSEILYRQAQRQRRLEIMQRYFEVVLADLDFYRYNEEMSVEFVRLDKLRDRAELGQVSDIEVLEQEARYQAVRQKFIVSQNRQRLSRARLAYALGRPGDLPATVARPNRIPHSDRRLPEVERLQKEAVQNNAGLAVLRARLAAARAELALARAGDNPTLVGAGRVATYSRRRSGYDDWRVELTLQVPLTDGGRSDAAASKARARIYELQAELADRRERLRQQVLELWLRLEALKAQRQQARSQIEFRELYLDRSRALYELEVRTDLGDAMVRYTQAERQQLATEFQIALAWEQLDLLLAPAAATPDAGIVAAPDQTEERP
jgi:outer membrane protein TolC